jgi:Reverse transcriptase (RNA-dependent DNA polymerase)
VSTLDIRKCFDRIPHAAIAAVTLSPKTVIKRTLDKGELNVDLNKTYRQRAWRYTPGEAFDLLRSCACDDNHLYSYDSSMVLGCPQGLAASALVADAVIANVLETVDLGDARLAVYSDNIAVACRTRAEARRMTKALLAAFAAHPLLSAQMTLRVLHQSRRADYGFEHLGYHLRRRCGRTVIEPTKRNILGFARRWQAWRADKREGASDQHSRPRLLSWISTFREWHRAGPYRAMVLATCEGRP